MEISHHKEADSDEDETDELSFIVGRDAMGDVFGNLAIKDDGRTAAGKNQEADNKRSKTKLPHELSIA